MKFYVGCHQPSDAQHFERAFISIERPRGDDFQPPLAVML